MICIVLSWSCKIIFPIIFLILYDFSFIFFLLGFWFVLLQIGLSANLLVFRHLSSFILVFPRAFTDLRYLWLLIMFLLIFVSFSRYTPHFALYFSFSASFFWSFLLILVLPRVYDFSISLFVSHFLLWWDPYDLIIGFYHHPIETLPHLGIFPGALTVTLIRFCLAAPWALGIKAVLFIV